MEHETPWPISTPFHVPICLHCCKVVKETKAPRRRRSRNKNSPAKVTRRPGDVYTSPASRRGFRTSPQANWITQPVLHWLGLPLSLSLHHSMLLVPCEMWGNFLAGENGGRKGDTPREEARRHNSRCSRECSHPLFLSCGSRGG